MAEGPGLEDCLFVSKLPGLNTFSLWKLKSTFLALHHALEMRL